MPSKSDLRTRLARIEERLEPVPAASISEAQKDALVRELSDAELARSLELCEKCEREGLSDEEHREMMDIEQAGFARLQAKFKAPSPCLR